jgi:hypothetical protein
LMLDTQGSSRVQPVEGAPAEPTPSEARPFCVGDRVRVVRKATNAESARVYWSNEMNECLGKVGVVVMPSHERVENIVRVKIVSDNSRDDGWWYPCEVLAHADEPAKAAYEFNAYGNQLVPTQRPDAPPPKYGGPHDGAADAWAAERGMRVVRWGRQKDDELVIGWSWDSPPTGWTGTPQEGSAKAIADIYIVEPLPAKVTPVADAPAGVVTQLATKNDLAELARRVEALEARLATTGDKPSPVAPPMPAVPVAKVRRWVTTIGSAQFHSYASLAVPLISRDGVTDIDRELIMLEEIAGRGVYAYDAGEVAARLAEIRAGE